LHRRYTLQYFCCTAPSGGEIQPVSIEASSVSSFLVTYIPEEPGKIIQQL